MFTTFVIQPPQKNSSFIFYGFCFDMFILTCIFFRIVVIKLINHVKICYNKIKLELEVISSCDLEGKNVKVGVNIKN